jgi:Protein of unknown function (DUF4058)
VPSPFPGMDPWLESASLWPDFHQQLAVSLRHVLWPLLPERYFVKVLHRRVTDLVTPEELGVVLPDAKVLERPRAPRQTRPRAGTATVTTPVDVQLALSLPGRQHYLQIVEKEDERVVTAIEILSPSNKRAGTRDRARYLRKRDAYLASTIHFLEIDLIRGGERWPAGREPRAEYRVVLSRAGARPAAQVWPVGLRDHLPVVPIPLSGTDPDVALDLQSVFDHAYDDAGYRRFVPHEQAPPEPTLSKKDLRWARGRIASRSDG